MKSRIVNNGTEDKNNVIEKIASNLRKEGYKKIKKIDIILCTLKEHMIEKTIISHLGNNKQHKERVRENLVINLKKELNLLLEQYFDSNIEKGMSTEEIFSKMKQPNYLKESLQVIIETKTDEFLNKQVNEIIDTYILTKCKELNIDIKNKEEIKTKVQNDKEDKKVEIEKIKENEVNINNKSTFKDAVKKYTNNYNYLYSSDILLESGLNGIRKDNKFENIEDYFKLQELKNKIKKSEKSESELKKIETLLKNKKIISEEEKEILINRKNVIKDREEFER